MRSSLLAWRRLDAKSRSLRCPPHRSLFVRCSRARLVLLVIVNADRGVDTEDSHAVELRQLGQDERRPDGEIDEQVARVVIRGDRGGQEQERGDHHEKLLRVGPRVALVDLLVERELTVVAH
ncbi:hypothetical protein PRIC1_003824 [Phytophthora ramorum]